jgi:hypothetical protein
VEPIIHFKRVVRLRFFYPNGDSMPKFNPEPNKPKTGQRQLSLSLKLETTDRNKPNVDADDFFLAAEKWLRALKIFAKRTRPAREMGNRRPEEIFGAGRSSAGDS